MKNIMCWWIIPKITKLVSYFIKLLAVTREVENWFRENASSPLSSDKYHWHSISRDWRWYIIDVFNFLESSSVFSTTFDNFSSVATFLALLYEVSFATSNKILADSSRSWMMFVTFPFILKPFKNFSQISKTFQPKLVTNVRKQPVCFQFWE